MNALLLAIVIIGAWVTLCTGSVALGRVLIRGHVAAFHNEVMISLFSAAGVIYAVLLAFLVIVVWQAYDGAHRNVADEAASLVRLYRLTAGMQATERSEMRGLIRRYSNAVLYEEWPTLGKSHSGSMNARKAIGNIDRVFAKIDSRTKKADEQIDTEFLRTKSKIVADRNVRLLTASETVPWVMWLGAIGGGIIVTAMGSFVYMERAWPHILMAGLMGSLIGLLLFIMIALARPFAGPLAINAQDFQYALDVMGEVDRGD